MSGGHRGGQRPVELVGDVTLERAPDLARGRSSRAAGSLAGVLL